MLDEYLENEGRLIDERASTFSQPVVDLAPPLAYELPTKSSSYVRTLSSVMQKQTGSSTSELISGFIPPSKRPKLGLKETRISRREPPKQRGPKPGRPKSKLGSAAPEPADSDVAPTHPAGHLPEAAAPEAPAIRRGRKKLKPRTLGQSPPGTPTPMPSSSEDMAPLESDSELGDPSVPGTTLPKEDTVTMTTPQEGGAPGMTRALLRQKDLEDGVIWEGCHRTAITEERASIALTSLFTLMVSCWCETPNLTQLTPTPQLSSVGASSLGLRQGEPHSPHPAGVQTCPPLSERLLQAGLHLLQPGLPRQDQPLWPALLHAGLQLLEAESGPPQEPGRLRLKPLSSQQEKEEEEEDEDGLW